MVTEQDYRLEPRSDELSQVICNHCSEAVGDVYVAQQTMTGRTTGRTDADVTTEARQIADEHLAKCPKRDQPVDPKHAGSHASTPPKRGPLDQSRTY